MHSCVRRRSTLILFISTALHCQWLIEQPDGSKDVLFRHYRLDYFSNVIAWVPRKHSASTAWAWGTRILTNKIYNMHLFKCHFKGVLPHVLDDALRVPLSKENVYLVKFTYSGWKFGLALNHFMLNNWSNDKDCLGMRTLALWPKPRESPRPRLTRLAGFWAGYAILSWVFAAYKILKELLLRQNNIEVWAFIFSGDKRLEGYIALASTGFPESFLPFSCAAGNPLRQYPYGFGLALVRHFKDRKPIADLRGKPNLNPLATDQEIFQQLQLGDCWWDADLPAVFFYLWENDKLQVPDSWKSTMQSFHDELAAVTKLL